jgi:UDP-N-acetylglucosamine 2-epimerase (non-hydrolysing)
VNLRREGIPEDKIFRVGNVMIDSLVRLLPVAKETFTDGVPAQYALVTLHRPANVDNSVRLHEILESLLQVNDDLAVVFPTHPRTRKRIADFKLSSGRLLLLEPLPYVEFLGLQSRATIVITDSGGIQEETTYLGIPCLTMRDNTERPITVSVGTNILVGSDPKKLRAEFLRVLEGKAKRGSVPPLWDGRAGARIANILCERQGSASQEPTEEPH